MKNIVDVCVTVAPVGQDSRQLLQIDSYLQVARHVVCAAHVSADGGVQGVSRQLADVLDVVDHRRQFQILRRGLADDPSGYKHPGI